MKNLVLSAVCLVGLTQATGCIISSSDDEPPIGSGEGNVTATWNLRSSDASGNVTNSVCPVGANTVRIFAQRGNDEPFTDDYDCVGGSGSGVASRLPVGEYAVWVQLTDTNGVSKFAESGAYAAIVAEDANTPISIDVFTDRAFFQASWQLERVGGGTTTCAAEGAGNMSILATVAGGVDGFDDDRNTCAAGEVGKSVLTTTPVPLGAPYTVVIAALNGAGASIGDSAPLTNRTFEYGNEFEDLGIVTVSIR